MNYLLDTNIISELVRKQPNKCVQNWLSLIPNEALFISVLTLGEIRKGVANIKDNHRKAKLTIWLEYELPAWFGTRILSVNQAVADRWGRLQSESKKNLSAIDSLLAATALHHDLSIVTRNTIDFQFSGLTVINPWEIPTQ